MFQDQQFDPRVFSNMQTGNPVATYKKTILGKVFVTVLDPFSHQPVGMLLEGEKGAPTESIDVWSDMEDMFFRRSNKKNLELGMIIKITRSESKEEKRTIEQYSDEELKEVINMKYLGFQKVLSAITSVAVALRLEQLSIDMEKSEKIVTAIRAKVAELQGVPQSLAS
jgi:hypothetical protein